MIEHKIDDDTVLVGRAIKISDLEKRKIELQSQQVVSQKERDEYDTLDVKLQEKIPPPIDFAPEIEEVTIRIDRYKGAVVGTIKPISEAPKWEVK